jgi:hypothetical protein
MIAVVTLCAYIILTFIVFFFLFQLNKYDRKLTYALDRIESKLKYYELKLENLEKGKK